MSVVEEVAQQRVAASRQVGELVQVDSVPWPILPHIWTKSLRTIRAAWHRQRFAGFGNGSVIDPPATLAGRQSIAIGNGVHIHAHSWIEALNAQGGELRLEIGDGTSIQRSVHIGAIQRITIGRGCLFASHVYITDHDHDFSDPMQPVVNNRRVIAAAVNIGDFVWLGERAMVLKGVTIGQRSIIGAGSIVTRDVPDLSIAVGSPARIIRRWEQSLQKWTRCGDADRD